jgi:hypothetical protein
MKTCPSFPGYMVSADGIAVSTRRRRHPLILRQFVNRKGYHTVHELRRDDLEHWATVRSGTRWCGLTAAEILVRLDEWLSARNG